MFNVEKLVDELTNGREKLETKLDALAGVLRSIDATAARIEIHLRRLAEGERSGGKAPGLSSVDSHRTPAGGATPEVPGKRTAPGLSLSQLRAELMRVKNATPDFEVKRGLSVALSHLDETMGIVERKYPGEEYPHR